MATSGSSDQPIALAEGRRIYLGNLLYIVQPVEIEEMLKDNGFSEYDKIHISMDPVTARNPGYCFVDFKTRADAERALSSLDTSIRSRPLKVGPCEPKRQQANRWTSYKDSNFNRWGNWSGQRGQAGDNSEEGGVQNGKGDKRRIENGPYGAIEHFDEVVATDTDGRRLYIGGLPKMIDQQQSQDEMREILTGFDPVAISKRITPHESTRSMPGNHHYCFVDFATVDEASAALKALNGKLWADERLRVNVAKPLPDKLKDRLHPRNERDPPSRDNTVWSDKPTRKNQSSAGERSSWRKPSNNDSSRNSNPSQPLRSLASGNWRTKE
ncbi:RNA recognition domain-containing protein [Colletotrichum navitas]|uniref:RNA recognition domain-containing protein n=1 Tax=Colletotrichum navitas TaxID=681940 RepID=A0AAD8V361_9PEZI|nr:RNA recognition domain-containing protein [Colletotrichum navitas]KAK1590490.1 RNA recognition domain-containing protein [Colletotrichum navitas]